MFRKQLVGNLGPKIPLCCVDNKHKYECRLVTFPFYFHPNDVPLQPPVLAPITPNSNHDRKRLSPFFLQVVETNEKRKRFLTLILFVCLTDPVLGNRGSLKNTGVTEEANYLLSEWSEF